MDVAPRPARQRSSTAGDRLYARTHLAEMGEDRAEAVEEPARDAFLDGKVDHRLLALEHQPHARGIDRAVGNVDAAVDVLEVEEANLSRGRSRLAAFIIEVDLWQGVLSDIDMAIRVAAHRQAWT